MRHPKVRSRGHATGKQMARDGKVYVTFRRAAVRAATHVAALPEQIVCGRGNRREVWNFRVPHSLPVSQRVRMLTLFDMVRCVEVVRHSLERRYGQRHLHFITCSCNRRMPLQGTAKSRDVFLEALSDARQKHRFLLVGYVVMPEHVHLLLSEPDSGTPSTIMQVIKQRVSRNLGAGNHQAFWQRRFYDFNVWSRKKVFEKLHYMHMNPVKRGLVDDPGMWEWSSYRYYQYGEIGKCTPDREPA